MISKLAVRITSTLCATSVIEEGDKELYIYGFFILLSRIFFFCVTVLFGFLCAIPLESVLFYVMFTLLRSYAGGVHARTENMCSVLTTLSLLTSIFGIRMLNFLENGILSLTILSIGAASIIALSPLDTPEKPLDRTERLHYRRISIIIVAAYLVLALLMYAMGLNGVLSAVTGSIALEAVLMISGKIMQLC